MRAKGGRMEADKNKTQVHKRRVRYKGTHPRKYSEKYKELNPEKYADTVAKVIRKGNTPAGMHISICVKEILDFLQIKPGQIGLDATLGYGGHTQKMLACLEGKGHIYGLDVDPIESVKTQKRLEEAGYGEEILTVLHTNFANIDEVLVRVRVNKDFYLRRNGLSKSLSDLKNRCLVIRKLNLSYVNYIFACARFVIFIIPIPHVTQFAYKFLR